ncbi:peptidase M23 [Patiriisocius marinistellae]|uniref:Peptidase M23 n=1 Tax=Patiriisocius marinistellae TaxID=2494560 RepID=A0A5J4G205_9FLAO|nr:M23 family metallopeptidase [Patiriisocius marinistellae]GEQ86555.1 peptidase M23 [Patiriisocius marinistellae]
MKTIITVLLLSSISICAQSLPQDYFDSPLDIPLILSGSFGELRSNHFHSGLDIKTQQREGVPIYAPADGFINRIKVAHYGYGKALYIKHPNGYATVYAHLREYAGEIEAFVKKAQYDKEKFEVELFPEATQLPVKKGALIGYTGNSGSSGGPHLHYEIRDSASRPMNPMLFGVDIPDTKKPIVTTVMAYPLEENAIINGFKNPVKLRLILQKDGSYKTEKVIAYGKIGFGINTVDQMNGASNKNGVYQIKTHFNGEEKVDIRFEKFSFGETRYLNRYIDYNSYKVNRDRVQKLFREPNNPLSIFKYENNKGVIEVENGFSSNFNIEVTDFKGNATLVSIPVEGKTAEISEEKVIDDSLEFVQSNQPTTINTGKFTIYIPKKAFYEDTYLSINTSGDTLHFHEDIIPVHKNISVSMSIENYTGADKSKLFIARLNYRGDPYYNTTRLKGNVLTARTRTLGNYALVADTTSPKIKAVNFTAGKWISNNKTLKIKIDDDLSGISSYRATINGKFILMEYNYKTDVLTYDFDDAIISETENNLKLIVTDNVGNSSTFEAQFFRKQL